MNIKRLVGYCAVLLFCFSSAGCISMEQEIFLNADGSGEMVLYVSVPDLPDELASDTGGMGPGKDPMLEMEKFKKEVTTGLPPTLKMKEVKEVRQNGSRGFYAVVQFKKIEDLNHIFANLGKESLKAPDMQGKSEWTVGINKSANKTTYTGRLLLEMDDKKKEKKEAKPDEPDFGELEEKITALILGTIKMRFVLHAPSAISESNADIILRDRTAVWNCSLAAFLKEKKPIEMKASFQ